MSPVDKRLLSERDICTKYVTPSMETAGWDIQTQVREEVYFTKGRVIVRGKIVKRGKAKRADYVLVYLPNLPIAIVEVKDTRNAVLHEYASLDDFLTSWNAAEQKQAIIDELEGQGVLLEALAEEVGKVGPVRLDLPRRLRPTAVNPPRAGRKRA